MNMRYADENSMSVFGVVQTETGGAVAATETGTGTGSETAIGTGVIVIRKGIVRGTGETGTRIETETRIVRGIWIGG